MNNIHNSHETIQKAFADGLINSTDYRHYSLIENSKNELRKGLDQNSISSKLYDEIVPDLRYEWERKIVDGRLQFTLKTNVHFDTTKPPTPEIQELPATKVVAAPIKKSRTIIDSVESLEKAYKNQEITLDYYKSSLPMLKSVDSITKLAADVVKRTEEMKRESKLSEKKIINLTGYNSGKF